MTSSASRRIILSFVSAIWVASCQAAPLERVSNRPPQLSAIAAVPESVAVASRAALSVTASDPDLDDLSYTWSSSAGSLEGDGPALVWRAPSELGMHVVSVVVSDGVESVEVARDILVIEVAEATNRAPVVVEVTADPSALLVSERSELTIEAFDDDGDGLLYTWQAEHGTISGTGSTVTYEAPASTGCCPIVDDVTVLVDDQRGGQASSTVSVDVSP